MREVSAPDLANALLMLVAIALEGHPACSTPQGMRLLAEAAGKELHELMKGARRLKVGDGNA